jgi:16S rRNA (uracil1498-N3)-methyltransferase
VRSSNGGPGAGLGPASPASLREAAAHVFVADLAAPELSPDDRHHLERVLRLRAGEVVTVSDGAGGWRACVLAGGTGGSGGSAAGAGSGFVLEPVGDVAVQPAPSMRVTVGFALTKGDKPEWAVQKLTEAGVDAIVPFVAARSVVRWDADKAARNSERLARVAREAAMQSRRVWLPEVAAVAPFSDAVAVMMAGPDRPVPALAEPGGAPLSLDHPCVLVGPEGGWSPEELGQELPIVSLGPTILRAETATMAAGLLLCAVRGGFVRNHDE